MTHRTITDDIRDIREGQTAPVAKTYQQLAHDIARECLTNERMVLGGRILAGFDRAKAHELARERGVGVAVHRWINMVTAVEVAS